MRPEAGALRQRLGVTAFLAALAAPALGQADALLPRPAEMQSGRGAFPIDGSFGVAARGCADPRVGRATGRLLERLVRQTGLFLSSSATPSSTPRRLDVRCGSAAPSHSWRVDESY